METGKARGKRKLVDFAKRLPPLKKTKQEEEWLDREFPNIVDETARTDLIRLKRSLTVTMGKV